MPPMPTRRRSLIGPLVSVLGLVGCSFSEPDADAPEVTQTTRDSRSTDGPTGSATPSEPRATRYQPHPAEIAGAAKRAAARAVEALPEVREVTYTQYFGYLPPTANILVEADFVDGGGTTYAVEISQAGTGWRVDEVTAAEPVARVADPGPLIRRVLNNDRIVLPWAGRVDVAAGLVSDAVLRSMLAVSERHRLGISVLISAHPVEVFGTDRRSNHPDGLAYDIGRIDGRLVIDPASADLVVRVMRLAASTGARQVGGPEDLDGGGSQYFSDATHSDHLHVGFDG